MFKYDDHEINWKERLMEWFNCFLWSKDGQWVPNIENIWTWVYWYGDNGLEVRILIWRFGKVRLGTLWTWYHFLEFYQIALDILVSLWEMLKSDISTHGISFWLILWRLKVNPWKLVRCATSIMWFIIRLLLCCCLISMACNTNLEFFSS